MIGGVMRLRQAVLVAPELEPFGGTLRAALGLGEPFADPGVGLFGLRNAVMALGGDFLEVVAPMQPGTAAGRHLERRGPGGYMVLVQVDDVDAARARADELGARAVWGVDLPDIRATHLHPGDMGGTILSIDQPEPPESWRWGGPGWEERAAQGSLRGVTIEVPEPDAAAERWGRLLGLAASGCALELGDGQRIAFARGERGLVEIAVEAPGRPGGALELGAARVVVRG